MSVREIVIVMSVIYPIPLLTKKLYSGSHLIFVLFGCVVESLKIKLYSIKAMVEMLGPREYMSKNIVVQQKSC